MKIWLSKNSEVPVREQIIAQITLGVVSGDLPVGEKLPSTREIARRFGVHANTVSSAYQKLVGQNLIEFKHGSGFFVSENEAPNSGGEFKLDRLIADFLKQARTLGYSSLEIRSHLQKWFDFAPPERFTVIESDAELREILIEEIIQATRFPVAGTTFEEFQKRRAPNTIFAAMIDEMPKIQTVLSPNENCFYLKARSVSDSLKNQTRPSENDLIAVASGWKKFLWLAKTMLVAAKVESDAIVLRSTAEADWRKGLENAALIICDALTAKNFSGIEKVRVFHLISDDSLKELKALINDR